MEGNVLISSMRIFLSTPSTRRATNAKDDEAFGYQISIHALHEEGDSAPQQAPSYYGDFYPRPPRGGRHCADGTLHLVFAISIHALHEEGDRPACCRYHTSSGFLSTPSTRRATAVGGIIIGQQGISIHALHEEGDTSASWIASIARAFLSTPSTRRATHVNAEHHTGQHISIHALHEEGDPQRPVFLGHTYKFLSTPSTRRATSPCGRAGRRHGHFYPRPPRGGRQITPLTRELDNNFYPRPPRGGRPDPSGKHLPLSDISIHALHEEGDLPTLTSKWMHAGFLSTPSTRRATSIWAATACLSMYFYPRPPRGGRRFRRSALSSGPTISIHALHEEGDKANGRVCRVA